MGKKTLYCNQSTGLCLAQMHSAVNVYICMCVCVRSNFTDWIWPDRPDRLLLQGESMVNFKDYVLFFCPDIRLSSDVHRRPLLLLLYRWSNIILFLADITWHQHFLAISTCHCSPGRFPKSWGYPSHHSHHHPFGIGIFHNQPVTFVCSIYPLVNVQKTMEKHHF